MVVKIGLNQFLHKNYITASFDFLILKGHHHNRNTNVFQVSNDHSIELAGQVHKILQMIVTVCAHFQHLLILAGQHPENNLSKI
jgi:hypothetical protein